MGILQFGIQVGIFFDARSSPYTIHPACPPACSDPPCLSSAKKKLLKVQTASSFCCRVVFKEEFVSRFHGFLQPVTGRYLIGTLLSLWLSMVSRGKRLSVILLRDVRNRFACNHYMTILLFCIYLQMFYVQISQHSMSHVGEVLKLPLMHQRSFITRTAWHERSLPEATCLVFPGDEDGEKHWRNKESKIKGMTGHEHII